MLRFLSRCSNSFTRLETLRHAGEDLGRSSSENTRSAGLNSCTRSDTLLQAGDFIKSGLVQLSTKAVPDPVKPLKQAFGKLSSYFKYCFYNVAFAKVLRFDIIFIG